MGGKPGAAICLCTPQARADATLSASAANCSDVASLCPAGGGSGPRNHSLPAALSNGHQGYL